MPSNILSAQLPSDDEADDDYDPTVDKTAEKQDLIQQEKPVQAKPKRKRGALLHGDESADEEEEEEQPAVPTDPIALAKRRKAMAAWEALSGNKEGCPAPTPVAAPTQPAGSKSLSLAALCKPAPKKNAKARADMVDDWCWDWCCCVHVLVYTYTYTHKIPAHTDVDEATRPSQTRNSSSNRTTNHNQHRQRTPKHHRHKTHNQHHH